MNIKKRYITVTCDSEIVFVKLCEEMRQCDWIPQGGVSIACPNASSMYYAQAFVREDSNEGEK